MADWRKGRGGRDGGAGHFPEVEQVRAYWEALRVDGAPPPRAALDPRGMAAALGQTFLIERVAPGVGRFRLAGSHLGELMGMEVRGMVLASLVVPEGRAGLAAGLEQVFSGPAILDAALEAERGIGRPALAGRMLLLPLAPEPAGGALALGCLATEGPIGRAPRSFAVAREAITRLAAAAEGTAAPKAPAPAPAPAAPALSGFAEPAAGWDGPPRRPQRPGARGHLRLVK